jgi:hypothetical protein
MAGAQGRHFGFRSFDVSDAPEGRHERQAPVPPPLLKSRIRHYRVEQCHSNAKSKSVAKSEWLICRTC